MKVRMHQRGITLIESLIAMAVLAMIMALAAPLLQMTLATTARTESLYRFAEEDRTAITALRRALGRAIVPAGTKGDVVFTGRGQDLRFFVYDSAGAVQELTLTTTNNDQGAALTLTMNPEGAGPVEEVVLLAGLSDLSLSYYGTPTSDAPATWRQRWSGARLPRLVRLTMVRDIRGERREVVIDLAVPAIAPLTCAFDPVSRQCREEE